MKRIITVLAFATCFNMVLAQQNSAQKTEMKKLAQWTGDWEGEGFIRMGPGEPKKSKIVEHIEWKLEEMILVLEGTGKSIDATKTEFISHHALGIVNYDEAGKQFKFKTYLADGKSADAYLIIVKENVFEWGFDTGRGKLRYTIKLDPIQNTWNEKGDFSSDGTTWINFFEMNLKKHL